MEVQLLATSYNRDQNMVTIPYKPLEPTAMNNTCKGAGIADASSGEEHIPNQQQHLVP
jgi:hypothetical protein